MPISSNWGNERLIKVFSLNIDKNGRTTVEKSVRIQGLPTFQKVGNPVGTIHLPKKPTIFSEIQACSKHVCWHAIQNSLVKSR